nr:immunoglobulin light chain junction region [Macaca mulatta]
CLQGYIPPYTF